MRDRPKECVNSNCRGMLYVPANQLHLPLICSKCVKKTEK